MHADNKRDFGGIQVRIYRNLELDFSSKLGSQDRLSLGRIMVERKHICKDFFMNVTLRNINENVMF